MTLQEYLQCHDMKLSTFAKQYQLDYHKLFRVTQGTVTRDPAIKQVFKQLKIINQRQRLTGEPNSLFMTQERVCIQCEPNGDIYCYYPHQLKEVKTYLTNQRIPHYVRAIQDGWLVRYDKEAEE